MIDTTPQSPLVAWSHVGEEQTGGSIAASNAEVSEVAGHASSSMDLTMPYYRQISRAIEKMKFGYSHLCFVRGRPGIGKSFQIEECLKAQGMQYAEVSGNVSEAYLYRILYEHNRKTIWFKDVVRLLRGLRSIDLLKGACETGRKRIIQNLNYCDKQQDLPKQFEFKGNLIFDFNSLTGLKFKEDFEALTTRGDFIDLVFGHQDICGIMRAICKTDVDREVTEYLISHWDGARAGLLNLRVQRQAVLTYQYAQRKGLDWQEEIRQELRNQLSPVQRLLYPILGNGPQRTSEIKKHMVQNGIVSTMRTADRRIADWLELGEIYQVSSEERDFFVALTPINVSRRDECLLGDTSDTPEAVPDVGALDPSR
jgi:hypothetical protein